MCDNVQNCCRICLDMESEQISILDNPTIVLHLKACLAMTISPSDNLTKAICTSCISLLNQFYNFQINARCSQDWLESSLQEKTKKNIETKLPLQPIPDSEYNSDSLLEFLNNTVNIEEYLNNLGKEDIPCIVNMLDKNENNLDTTKTLKTSRVSPLKKEAKRLKLESEVSESNVTLIKNVLQKDVDTKNRPTLIKRDRNTFLCFGCKLNFESVSKLLHHLSLCDLALRTCIQCNMLFNSKQQMQQHSISHNTTQPILCNCGEQFQSKEKLRHHHRTCHTDYATSIGCMYRCKECGDTFKERFQLYKHAKEHIIKTDEKVCDICGHYFADNNALITHKKEVHQTSNDVVYRCKVCSYTSADRKEIYLHVKHHTKCSVPRRHLCESCGHSFATGSSLNRHVLLHNNGKTLCSICNKYFIDAKCLDDHMLEHVKMVICEKCGKSVNSFQLDTHNCV